MAIFNPDQDPVNPDWTSASRGFKANTAGAELFNDLGQSAITAVQIADQNNLTNIETEVQSEVDQATDEWGTKASAFETNIHNTKNIQPLPEDLQRYGDQLAKVRKAYLQGSLKDSNFQARIDSMSRQIRARYPGYREDIDKIIAGTLGRSTANDLRKSLMAEWNSEQSALDDEDKRFRTDLISAIRTGDVQPDWMIRQAEGRPYTKEETYIYMQASYLQKAQLEKVGKEIDHELKVGNYNDEKINDFAVQTTNEIVRRGMEGSLSLAGDTTPAKLLQQIQSGFLKPPQGEDLAKIQAAYTEMRTNLESSINATLLNSRFDRLSAEQKRNIRSEALAPMDTLKEALFNQQYGYMNASKQTNDTRVQDVLKVFGNNPMFVRLQAAQKLGNGSEIMDAMLLKNPQMLKDLDLAVSSILTGDMFLEDAPQKGLSGILEDANSKLGGTATKPALSKAVTKATIHNATRMLLDDKASPEVQQQAASILFGEANQDLLDNFEVPSRMPLFKMLVTPRITDHIVNMAKDNPAVLENYTNWVMASGVSLFKKDADTINDVNVYGDWLDIQYNPETMQLKAEPTMGSLNSPEAIRLWEQYKASEGKKSMDNLNYFLKQIQPVVEANGEDPQQFLIELMGHLEVNMEARQGNLWTRFLEVAVDKLQHADERTESDKELESLKPKE